MIFMKQLSILFFTFFSPVQLTEYQLKKADFNTGEAVYENNVVLSTVEERTYKITSTEGEKTFRMWDFVTLLGSFVEFDILVLDSDARDVKIRCVFKTAALAENLSYSMKPEVLYEVAFPIYSIAQVYEDLTDYAATSIRIKSINGGVLHEELRNRFIVFSQADVPVMIFSAGYFNLSSVMSDARVLMTIQVYDIEKGELVRLKILIKFKDNETANHFHEFVTENPPCTDNMIPVEIPSHISP